MSDQPSPPKSATAAAAAMAAAISRKAAEQQSLQMMQGAIHGSTPKLYANTFATAQTASDMSLILITNGAPVAVVSMSYISAKSLIVELTKVLTNFETAINEKVKTIEEISGAMAKVMENTGAKPG